MAIEKHCFKRVLVRVRRLSIKALSIANYAVWVHRSRYQKQKRLGALCAFSPSNSLVTHFRSTVMSSMENELVSPLFFLGGGGGGSESALIVTTFTNISSGKQIQTSMGLISVSLSNVMYCVYDLFVSCTYI